MSSPLKLRKTSYFNRPVDEEEEELGKDDESISMPTKAVGSIDLHAKFNKTKNNNNNQLEI